MNVSVSGTLVLMVCFCGWGCRNSNGTPGEPRTYKLYFLGGQSNMEGFGFEEDLPAELKPPRTGVMIFHGNDRPDDQPADGRGIWAPLRPGHGSGFSSDGSRNDYSGRFGPELTFGDRLAGLERDTPIAIIKYSRGGSSIGVGASEYGTWDPDYGAGGGINQFDHFLATVNNALAAGDVNGDGTPDRFVPAGIVWMQGEADALHGEESARQYGANLKRLMARIRTAFGVDDLPVVIGRISDSGQDADGRMMDYADIVRRAQAGFVEGDANAALVTSTDGYGFLDDGWHFDSRGFIDLGEQFAEAVHDLHNRK